MTEVSAPRAGRPRSKSRPAPLLNRGQAELRGTRLAVIAAAAGCSKKSASRWLRGDKVPDDAHAARLEQALGVSRHAWRQVPTRQKETEDDAHDARLLDESALGLLAKARPYARDIERAINLLIEEPQLPPTERAAFCSSTLAGLPPSWQSALLPAFEEWQAEL